MKELRYTRQFKKDLKRFLNQPKKLEELKIVLDMLRNEITLPEKYRQHPLKENTPAALNVMLKAISCLYGMMKKVILLHCSGLAPIQSCLRIRNESN